MKYNVGQNTIAQWQVLLIFKKKPFMLLRSCFVLEAKIFKNSFLGPFSVERVISASMKITAQKWSFPLMILQWMWTKSQYPAVICSIQYHLDSFTG